MSLIHLIRKESHPGSGVDRDGNRLVLPSALPDGHLPGKLITHYVGRRRRHQGGKVVGSGLVAREPKSGMLVQEKGH